MVGLSFGQASAAVQIWRPCWSSWLQSVWLISLLEWRPHGIQVLSEKATVVRLVQKSCLSLP